MGKVTGTQLYSYVRVDLDHLPQGAPWLTLHFLPSTGNPFERPSPPPKLLKTEVLAGLVVALALIPEAIAFSIIAGVDPRLGLFASFTMAVTTALLGGRPAMISVATGAIALVIAPLVASHGIDYFIATVILAGVFQVLLAVAGIAKLMRFIPRQVTPLDGVEAVTYRVEGALFFASSNDLYYQFQYGEDPQTVVIDLSDSHIWDASTVSALDSITAKYERLGKTVRIQGLNPTSQDFQDRLSGQLGAGH